MTSTEFVKWVRYLEWRDVEEFRREDYYLAQIAAEVQRANSKPTARITIDKKMIKFTTREAPKDPSHQNLSKAYWLGLVGAGKDR